jgi:hypothetical protein
MLLPEDRGVLRRWRPVLAALTLTVPTLGWGIQAVAQDTLSPLARSIQDDVDRLESRVVERDDRRLQSDRLQRSARDRRRDVRLIAPATLRTAQDISLSSDLGAAQQDLRTLKTRSPNAEETPVLERRLDRISREAGGSGLYRPSRNPAALYAR